MLTTTKPPPQVKARRPAPPVTGKVRWAVQPGLAPAPHPGVLVITTGTGTAAYRVEENRDRGRVVGYRLVKPDGTVYDVDADTWGCSCPDATYRERTCKHAAGLQAGLKALDR